MGKLVLEEVSPTYTERASIGQSRIVLSVSTGVRARKARGAGATLAGIPQEGTIHCKWARKRRRTYSYQHIDTRIGR